MEKSSLLVKLFDAARKMGAEDHCGGYTIDHLMLAAIDLCQNAPAALSAQEKAELAKVNSLVAPYSGDAQALKNLRSALQNRKVPFMQIIQLQGIEADAEKAAAQEKNSEVTADVYVRSLLAHETDAIKALKDKSPSGAPAQTQKVPAQTASTSQSASQADAPLGEAKDLEQLVENTKRIYSELSKSVLGQAHAVSTFASGYFQAELQAMMEKDRKRPRATFLFAGPPGVGKTFLAEEAARVLGIPHRRYDMSEYTSLDGVQKLTGSSGNWKSPSEGLLTGFVATNPRCLLLFDEIEKACIDVIHLFLQVLDAGQLKDEKQDKEISFKDTIIIFTTNAAKQLYDTDRDENLGALTRDVILDALGKDINPKTQEPFFPAAIVSRFASGNVLMFNHLDAYTLESIVSKQLDKHIADFESQMRVQVSLARQVPAALVFAEGAGADARTVKSRADSFFSTELYELFRLTSSKSNDVKTGDIAKVRFELDLDSASQEICDLFTPRYRLHIMAYAQKDAIRVPQSENAPVVHCVDSREDAERLLDQEKIHLCLCDLNAPAEGETGWLNREDVKTRAREFLFAMLKLHPEIPCVVLDTLSPSYSQEERDSFLRRGVRGFIDPSQGDFDEQLDTYIYSVFTQACMRELSKSNQLMRYETAQILDDPKSARIVMFDMRLDQAVRAEDADNVLSALSRPKERFADVYGADEAKQELQYFVNYMKEPEKYSRLGAKPPKGILLYGPPGTGKTMLARAFANESGATFIAAVGSQFRDKWIGSGQKMMGELFAAARRYAPSILFIDEIDVIGRKRTGQDNASNHDQEEILTRLFSEMDGFKTDRKHPVFVLGATNYSPFDDSMRLDEGLMRRFDRRILVDLPNLEGRRRYLADMCAKQPIFHVSDDMIASLADRSVGMSLANLQSVMELAVRNAMMKAQSSVEDADLNDAFERFNSGETHTRSAEETLRTARHETGHAMISILGGNIPSYVTVVSRGNMGGYMQHSEEELSKGGYTRKELLGRIRTALGGRASEIVYYGAEDGISTGASSDLRQASAMARALLCNYGMDDEFGLAVTDPTVLGNSPEVTQGINRILKEQLEEAIRLLESNRDAMEALIAALLKKNSLNAADIKAILGK